MLHQKILGLNVRPQNVADFAAISQLVTQRAPEIGVLGRPGDLSEIKLVAEMSRLPQLMVYLVNPPLAPPQHGCTLTVEQISKFNQFLSYQRIGVATPLTTCVRPELDLPPDIWGERVVIKPMSDSFGRGVAVIETRLLGEAIKARGPELTRLLDADYLVQQFVDTGPTQEKFRVTVFMGEVVLSYRVIYRKAKSLPAYTSISDAVADEYFTSGPDLRYQLLKDPELDDFARQVYAANSQCPVQGLDIQRGTDGRFYVIENNAGGNVWKFSDARSAPFKIFGAQRMIDQYDAWDVCAEALIDATQNLAC